MLLRAVTRLYFNFLIQSIKDYHRNYSWLWWWWWWWWWYKCY